MDELLYYYQTIQSFMDNVKKEILSKANNLYNLRNSRDILNSLFELFNYQITLMNQIILFIKNINQNSNINNYIKAHKNSNNNSLQNNNINYLININKDIMVSMIFKFLSKINLMLNIYKNRLNNKKNTKLNNESIIVINHGKIRNQLYPDNNKNNKNILLTNSNSFNNNINLKSYPISKRSKDLNASVSKTHRIYNDDFLNINNKNIKIMNNKFNKNKEIENNKKELKYKNLLTDIKNIDNQKKPVLHKSNSTNNKNIFIDLNDNAIKKLFNMSIYYKCNNNIKLINKNNL